MKVKAQSTHKKGKMNGTERTYYNKLAVQLALGEIKSFDFESITLKIGSDCRYTPDFFIINKNDEIEFHEIKGFWRDDALVKIKVAAEKFPFIFKAYQFKDKQWIEKDYTQL